MKQHLPNLLNMADVESARLHVSQLAKLLALLVTRSVRMKNASNQD